MDAEPTLADDEAMLASVTADLLAGLERAVPLWLRRRAARLAPDVDQRELDRAIAATMEQLGPELRRVLGADVDEAVGSPLAVLRTAAAGPVTGLLRSSGAARASRDRFDSERFPDDLFALGPASFADIDESLHEPGLRWGAARAHVHLRRRREPQ